MVTATHPHLGGPPTSPRVRVFSTPQFPLVAGHDIRTPRPSTLASRHVRMPSDASESSEHPRARSEIRQSEGHPFPASDSRVEPRWSLDLGCGRCTSWAAPCGRPLWPPPFPGRGRGPASCYLIFSAIPFAQLYLTRSTPLRRSLGHRILHIATRSRPPCLGDGGGVRGKAWPKNLCHL